MTLAGDQDRGACTTTSIAGPFAKNRSPKFQGITFRTRGQYRERHRWSQFREPVGQVLTR